MSKQQWIAENLKPGEEYAGLILGKHGDRDHHLVLLPQRVEGLTWEEAMAWARESGVTLPTRREQMLLFANIVDRFELNWYWSDLGFVWGQTLGDGERLYTHLRVASVRAIRRVPLEGEKE
jgi:hypothetical protein